MSVPENNTKSKQADTSDATADYVVQVTATELRRLRGDSQAVHLWCILLTYADWDTGKCHPSRSTLATDMGVSTDTVDRARGRLQAVGLLATEQRKDQNGNHTSNEYTLIRQRVSAPQRIGMGTAADRVSANLPIGYGQPCGEGMGTDADQTNTRGTSTSERVPVNKKEHAANAAAPAGLLAFVDCWNTNCPEGKQTRRDPPTTSVLRGWKRLAKEPELRQAFTDLERLGAAIRKATWAREQPWFTAESLFAKDSNRLQWKIEKLLRGDYDGENGHANSKRAPLQTRGLRYDPAAPIADHL